MTCIEGFYAAMEQMGDTGELAEYKRCSAALKAKINELCWDGDWYWRTTHDDGWVTGTKNNTDAG